jgi:hypothetical protein
MILAAQGLANVEMLSRSDPFLELARLQVGHWGRRAAGCCAALQLELPPAVLLRVGQRGLGAA